MRGLHVAGTLEQAQPSAGEGLADWLLQALRKVLRAARNPRRGRRTQMHLLESLSLGGRKQLMLVSCGGERFLIGTGADSIETIVPLRAQMIPLSNPDRAEQI